MSQALPPLPDPHARPALRPPISSPRDLLGFSGRVIKEFFRHNGLILAGAIAYNALLSIIPLLAIVLLSLSQFFEKKRLLDLINDQIQQWFPGYSHLLVKQVKGMLDHPELFGVVGIAMLLFFSSIAFSVAGRATQEIFGNQANRKRKTWLSLLLPYIYILVIALLLLVLFVFQSMISYVSAQTLALLGISIAGLMGFMWHGLSFAVMALVIASLYVVMPGGNISFRRALLGGLSATLLWEIVRRIMLWYFSNISMVNVIYGSLGAVIIILLCFEVAAIIFLLGAQVIAELERTALPLPEDPAEEVTPPMPL